MTQVVISLSTIPPRFSKIGKTLSSLLNQSTKPDKIELWIPRSYRRFPDHAFCLPNVPDGVTIEVAEDDLGPATKVLPCAKKYRGTDTLILYVDDDRIYWQHLLRTRLAAEAKRSGMCIATYGYDVEMLLYVTDRFYMKLSGETNKFKRRVPRKETANRSLHPRCKRRLGGVRNLVGNLSHWIAREVAFAGQMEKDWMIWPPDSGYVDIAEGFGGVLVRPDFFDDEAFDIPPGFWSADDPWLAGCLARRSIPTWVELMIKKRGVNASANDDEHSLTFSVIEGYNRSEAYRAIIQYFQEQHGVWC